MKYWQLFLRFLLVFCTFQVAKPLNILALIGTTIEMHAEWYSVLFEELVARKHNLTIVSTYEAGIPKFNTTFIKLELKQTNDQAIMNEIPYTLSKDFGPFDSFTDLKSWYRAQEEQCDLIMQTPGYQKVIAELLRAPPEIDLILYDITFNPWCVLILADFFENVSIFALSAFKALPEHFKIARSGVASPGITPSFINHHSTAKMGILERYWNAILHWYGYYLKFSKTAENISVILAKNPTVKKYDLSRKLKDVMSRIKLIFVNSLPAIDYAMPLPPNIIEIGGMHVRKPEHLHAGITEAVSKGLKGAIFIDLGKHMSLQKLGHQIVNDMLNVIERNHDYIFLWNIEDSELIAEQPNNLFTDSTYQRNEILAHPDVKLFITEASNMNIQESIYFGVPLVVLPLNMDQPHNAVLVAERRFGHHILFKNMNVPNFHKVIVDTLNCEECIKSVQRAKNAIHRNPYRPIDTLMGWIENAAVKYPQSYDYLVSRSAEHHGYWTTHSLDVFALAMVIMSLIIIIFVLLLSKIYALTLRIRNRLRNNHYYQVIVEFINRVRRRIPRMREPNDQRHVVVYHAEAANSQSDSQTLSDVSDVRDDVLPLSDVSSDHTSDD